MSRTDLFAGACNTRGDTKMAKMLKASCPILLVLFFGMFMWDSYWNPTGNPFLILTTGGFTAQNIRGVVEIFGMLLGGGLFWIGERIDSRLEGK